jgi:hypothetical protein
MLLQTKIQKTKRKNRFNFLKYIIIFVLIILFSFYIYQNRNHYYLFIRSIFLSEDIKYIESKNKHIENKLIEWIQNNHFNQLSQKEKEMMENLINDNINILHYFENSSNNLKEIYYYLSLSYFYKTILITEFSKEELVKQILRGTMPPIKINLTEYQKIIENLQKYSKKYLAIENDHEYSEIQLISIIADILNFRILSKNNYLEINQIPKKQTILWKPFYEWYFLVLNSNYGNIDSILSYFKEEHYWQFSQNEQLLIITNTYYYKKDYFNLLQTFLQYKNMNINLFNNQEILKNEHNTYERFIYKEFLRLLAETYFLQKNYTFSLFYIKQLEEWNKNLSDEFINQRIEFLKNKIVSNK